MQAVLQLVGQQPVNMLVGRNPALAEKRFRYDHHAKMRFTFGPSARMSRVFMRFVDHFEVARAQFLR